MPLLNKEPFVPVPVPHDLSPDDEVFYLPLTDEIFTSHDAFFERSILTNSLVWTCSVSGKSPLTYEEALESESQSKILIQTFPKPMQIPILYLMRYITTSASRDICDMIYIFVCNRYFLGETVDIIKNDLKLSGEIIKVISPTEDYNASSNECLGQTVSYRLDPHLYKYQVKVNGGQEKVALINKIKQADALKLNNKEEQEGTTSEEVNIDNSSLEEKNTNDSDNDDIIIDASCILRPKGIFSKDRLRLFLRHHLAETKRNQVFDIKTETKELYNLNDVSWTDFFTGPEPKFDRKNNTVVKIKEPTLTKDITNKVIKQIKEGEDSQRKRKLSENEAVNGEEQPLKKKKKKKSEGAENSSDTNVETPSVKKKKKKQKDGDHGATESATEGSTDKSKKKGSDGTETPAHTPKKKKYPYDPHKYDMPVPEGIDPDLLTSTGKIDGRKLKNKKNKDLAEELLATKSPEEATPKKRGPKPGSARKKSQESDVEGPEKSAKKKTKTPAEIAKEKELEAKRKKEAMILAKQLEKQKREEERKAIAAFLQEWEKKCEDLERDDLRPLPTATPIDCDIPQEHFGDAIYIMEVFYNFQEIFSDFKDFCPTGIDFDTLEEILLDKNDDSALGTVVQYLLNTIFNLQPTQEGLGVEEETKESAHTKSSTAPETNSHSKSESVAAATNSDQVQNGDQIDVDNAEISVDGVSDIDEDDHNKEINMNDLIGSAIKAAQDVQASIKQPLYEIELDSNNVTEVLRLHLLQSGTYPKSRSVYNGWYSAREDPGLWLCMQEPELIKKLSDTSIFDLNMDERIKLIHALINQVFSFIGTRAYIETANERLNELRKEYRATAAAFARWDRENCVKKLQHPKRKNDHATSTDKSDHEALDQESTNQIKDHQEAVTIVNSNGKMEKLDLTESDPSLTNGISMTPLTNGNIKSCLKTNGHVLSENCVDEKISTDEPLKKKISFNLDSAISTTTERKDVASENSMVVSEQGDEQEPTFEDLEKVYEENLVAYDEYQVERSKRLEEHNTQLIHLRAEIRNVQSLYGVHPIGKDRAYRRYWLFQSLPGLFVEWDDTDLGPCLEEATPTESRFKLRFNKDNPSDLQSDTYKAIMESKLNNKQPNQVNVRESIEDSSKPKMNGDSGDVSEDQPSSVEKSKPTVNDDKQSDNQFEEMARCSGDESKCVVHGKKNSENRSRWWFYHSAESIDYLIETLNKRGNRESELLETLTAEKSTIREWVSDCPAFKLNKLILEQSGIRRSRRLRQKTHKRRTRAMSYE